MTKRSFSVVEAVRLLVAIGAAFLFNQASASEEQTALSDAYASANFVVANAKLNRGYLLGLKIYELMELGKLPNGRPALGTYSNADLKRFLEEFDKIQLELGAPIEGILEPDQEAIGREFVREFRARSQNSEAANFYQSEKVLSWAKQNSAFLVEALPLSSLVNVFRVLSPEQFKDPTPSDVKDLKVRSGEMVSIHHVYFISQALNSEPLRSLLPERFDTERLRHEEARLRLEAEQLFDNAAFINHSYLIDTSYREATRSTSTERKLDQALKQQYLNAVGKLQILTSRAAAHRW